MTHPETNENTTTTPKIYGPFLTTQQVAEYFHISPRQVRRLFEQGTLKSVMVGQRSRRVPQSEIERYERDLATHVEAHLDRGEA